eukprot:gene3292-3212_t
MEAPRQRRRVAEPGGDSEAQLAARVGTRRPRGASQAPATRPAGGAPGLPPALRSGRDECPVIGGARAVERG